MVTIGTLYRKIFLFGNIAEVNIMWIPMPKESFSSANRACRISKVLFIGKFFDCNKPMIAVTTKIFLVSLPIFPYLYMDLEKQCGKEIVDWFSKVIFIFIHDTTSFFGVKENYLYFYKRKRR